MTNRTLARAGFSAAAGRAAAPGKANTAIASKRHLDLTARCSVAVEAGAPGPRGVTLDHRTLSEVHVNGDRTALKQALANLISNAVRVAPAASTVTVEAGVKDSWAFVSVADEGPGIEEAHQDKIFERFWRAPGQTESDGERRSGLGLTIVREIADRHGGTVAMASQPGRGSTFVLWLPPS